MTEPFDLDRDAALAGTTAIEASAGTGKTWSVEQIVVRRVLAGMAIDRVLLITFTRTAAEELAERSRGAIQRRLDDDGGGIAPEARGKLEHALLDFDAACITTIHGFCQRMLSEHATEAGEYSLEGWSLDPAPKRSVDLAIEDAWSATALIDPQLAHLAGSLKESRGTISKILNRDQDGHPIADFAAAVALWRHAADAMVADRNLVSAILALAEGLLAESRRILEACADALARVDGADPSRRESALVSATKELARGPGVAGGILVDPDSAARASKKDQTASSQALMATPDWRARSKRISEVVDLWDRAQIVALETIGAAARSRLLDRRARLRLFHYDDIIIRMHKAVHTRPDFATAVSDRFDLVVVDEVQDTDRRQTAIIKRLFIEPRKASDQTAAYLVGDPKQSIYGFRGVEFEGYIALRALARKQIRALKVSYRSDPKLVDGVTHLFAVTAPFFHAEIGMDPVRSAFNETRMRGPEDEDESGVRILCAPTAPTWDTLFSLVAWAIQEQLQRGIRVTDGISGANDSLRPLRPEDLAVLCRDNRQVRQMLTALRELNVPAVALGRGSVFESDAAQEIVRLVAALAAPNRRDRALAACAGSLIGMSAREARTEPEAWTQKIRDGAVVADKHGVANAVRTVVGDRLADLVVEPDGERDEADLVHLLELIDAAEASGICGAQAISLWLAGQIDGVVEESDDQRSRLVGGADAVKIQTLHSSKGLTYGITWLPSFMKPRKNREDDPTARLQQCAEERRLLYVGLTRSRWQSNLVWAPDKAAGISPLATLLHARSESDHDCAAIAASAALKDPVAARAQLDALAGSSRGTISVVALPTASAGQFAAEVATVLHPARAAPIVPPPIDHVSFTSLCSRSAHEVPDIAGLDRDESAARRVVAYESDAASPCDRELRKLGVTGTRLGTAIHETLEEISAFAAIAPGADRKPLVEALESRLCSRATGSPRPDLTPLAEALAEALSISPESLDWPTTVQCASMTRGVFRELKLATSWRASAADVADAFEREDAPWSGALALEVRKLGGAGLRGMFVGTLDLVCMRDDRWFIADYKTNDLGTEPEQYSQIRSVGGLSALDQAMIASRYPLQAALYAVAVRQWIASRRGMEASGTSPIGGISYLFLRGMDPLRPGQGIWTWNPSLALLDALGECVSNLGDEEAQ